MIYALLLILAIIKRDLVIDEGISLGWANYFNLMIYKKALKPSHVVLLTRLDLVFFRAVSKIRRIYYYFVDRSLEKLEFFWRKRGNRVPYDIKFSLMVRYSFDLFVNIYKRCGIEARVKYITL